MSYTLFLLLWAPQCPFCLSNGMSLQKKRAKTAKEATSEKWEETISEKAFLSECNCIFTRNLLLLLS